MKFGGLLSLTVCLLTLACHTTVALAQSGRLKVETDEERLDKICILIEQSAAAAEIPEAFFARLIWKESRFDENALSPVGAQGIAQFMPGTAEIRGLKNPFDMTQALPASAQYLSELKTKYGNLGLAAAAYNAGEARVSRWLVSGGFLPLETENFVATITGDSVDVFTNRDRSIRNLRVEPDKSFAEGCRRLPIIRTSAPAMAERPRLPWAVQVAGNFRRSAAERAWDRVRRRNASLLRDLPVSIGRERTPIGRTSIYAVRVGAPTRADANRICGRLRANGGSCIVMKN